MLNDYAFQKQKSIKRFLAMWSFFVSSFLFLSVEEIRKYFIRIKSWAGIKQALKKVCPAKCHSHRQRKACLLRIFIKLINHQAKGITRTRCGLKELSKNNITGSNGRKGEPSKNKTHEKIHGMQVVLISQE